MKIEYLWKVIQRRLKEQESLAPHIQAGGQEGGLLKFPHITVDLVDTGKSNGLPKGHYKGLFTLIINIWSKSHNPLEVGVLMEMVQKVMVGELVCDDMCLDISLQKTEVTVEKTSGPPLVRHGVMEFEVVVRG